MPIIDSPGPINLAGFNAGWTFSPRSGLDTLNSAYSAPSPLPSAAVYALLQGQGTTISQAFTATLSGTQTYTVKFHVGGFWWPNASQKLDVQVDGVVKYSTGAINSGIWNQRTFTVALPPGVHTLTFVTLTPDTQIAPGQFAPETAFLDSVTITDPGGVAVPFINGNPSFDLYALAPGQIIYNPPAVATPTLHADPIVTTCGRLIKFTVTPIAGGAGINSGTIQQAPTVQINGVDRGPLATSDAAGPLLSTAAHSSFLVPLPAGVTATASDVVTLTAPAGWLFGASAYAEAMVAQVALNRVGRSFERLVDVPRTMALGASYTHGATPEWHGGFLPKNQRYRNSYWQPDPILKDSHGTPLVLTASSTLAPVVVTGAYDNVGLGGYPTPPGLWGVAWTDGDGHSDASLTGNGAVNTAVTPVGSVDLPISGGHRRFRVYDFQPTGAILPDYPYFQFVTNLRVWLRITSSNAVLPTGGYPIAVTDLAILAPGDFAWTPGQQTIPPTPHWSEVAACVEAKLPPGLPFGPHRLSNIGIALFESSVCEREDVVEPDDWHWTQDNKRVLQSRYIQARPWTNAASPYIYDPAAGADYPATLSAPITSVPASGTVENITLAQVGDGLILTGLVLTIGSEKFRVMANPTGPTTALVTSVMRGVASTIPATHPAGTISVSARRPIADLTAFGVGNIQVTELVAQSPHGLKTGQIVPMDGNGWVPFTWSDGRGFTVNRVGFAPYHMVAYVTGANTFLTLSAGPMPIPIPAPNTNLSTTYSLNPGPIQPPPASQVECLSTLFLPESGGTPFEVAATVAARHPGAPARQEFPMVASDDMIDSIWRRTLAHLPADRDCYIECSDEPWNYQGTPNPYWQFMSWNLYGINSPYYWYAIFVGHIRDRGRAIWQEAGRDPSHVKGAINVQCSPGGENILPPLFSFLSGRSAMPDLVEIAPYYDYYYDPAFYVVWAAWTTEMLVDAWIWDFYHNTSPGDRNWPGGQTYRVSSFKIAIDAWNLAHKDDLGHVDVKLGIYEYGASITWPVYNASIAAPMDATTTTLTLANATARNPHDDEWDNCAKVCPGTWLRVGDEWVTVVARLVRPMPKETSSQAERASKSMAKVNGSL